jgi:hypothetical protein
MKYAYFKRYVILLVISFHTDIPTNTKYLSRKKKHNKKPQQYWVLSHFTYILFGVFVFNVSCLLFLFLLGGRGGRCFLCVCFLCFSSVNKTVKKELHKTKRKYIYINHLSPLQSRRSVILSISVFNHIVRSPRIALTAVLLISFYMEPSEIHNILPSPLV